MDYKIYELNFIKDDYINFVTDCFNAKKDLIYFFQKRHQLGDTVNIIFLV